MKTRYVPHALAVAAATLGSYLVADQVVKDTQAQLEAAASVDATADYFNAVDACERGNPLRGVVYRNTAISVKQSKGIGDPPKVTQVFEDNKAALLSTPGIDPETGEVDCLAVIKRPPDADPYVPPEQR